MPPRGGDLLRRLWVLATMAAGCSPTADFGRAGDYTARLTVTERGPLLPEFRAAFGDYVDTLSVALDVDSVAGDSLFGRWDADFSRVGTHGGPTLGGQPFRLSGRWHQDSVVLRLEPGHTDGDVWLLGVVVRSKVQGTWSTAYAPRVSGTFVLR